MLSLKTTFRLAFALGITLTLASSRAQADNCHYGNNFGNWSTNNNAVNGYAWGRQNKLAKQQRKAVRKQIRQAVKAQQKLGYKANPYNPLQYSTAANAYQYGYPYNTAVPYTTTNPLGTAISNLSNSYINPYNTNYSYNNPYVNPYTNPYGYGNGPGVLQTVLSTLQGVR